MTEDCIRGLRGRRRAPAARRGNIGGAGANLGTLRRPSKSHSSLLLLSTDRPPDYTSSDLGHIVFVDYVAILTGMQQEAYRFSVPSVGIPLLSGRFSNLQKLCVPWGPLKSVPFLDSTALSLPILYENGA